MFVVFQQSRRLAISGSQGGGLLDSEMLGIHSSASLRWVGPSVARKHVKKSITPKKQGLLEVGQQVIVGPVS